MSVLDISKREFPKLPGEIESFVPEPDYFEVLFACNCKTILLQCFTIFKKLEVLDLSNNELGGFVKSNTLSGLFLLKVLILKKNGITSFSDQFFQTTKNIQMLDLSENKISKCQRAFLDLPKLLTLNLNKNSIDDLKAFKIFKANPHIGLRYLGIRQNVIESNYRSKFENQLTAYFPNVSFVLTIYSQQRELNAFSEILAFDYYMNQPESAPILQECSFHNESLIANCVVSQPQTSAKKSKRSVNSCDSRFGSLKKRDPDYLRKQIEFRRKELERLDQSIEQNTKKRNELYALKLGYQQFLEDCNNELYIALELHDNTLLETVLRRMGEHCSSIDSLNQQKGRTLVTELLNSLKSRDSMDIDQALQTMESIMQKMKELMSQS